MPTTPKDSDGRAAPKPRPKPKSRPKPDPQPAPQPETRVNLQGSDNAVAVGPKSFAANIKIIFQGNWKPFAVVLGGVLVTLFVILYFVIPKQACTFDKEFTVAVAEFIVKDDSGKVIRDDAGLNLADSIAGQIEALFKEMRLDTVTTYEICVPKQIGILQSEQDARDFVLSKGAAIIVYGQVRVLNGEYFVSPRFYVNSTAFKEAEEITGEHDLGDNVKGKLDADIILAGSPGVQARVEGLSMLTIGLVYYSVDDYGKALSYFQKADNPAWVGSGKETVKLLIGNVYIRQASKIKDFSTLPEAEKYYQAALDENKNYGRAKIGMANVLYLRAYIEDDCDPAGLRDASTLLDEASILTDQPASANIETKVHFYRGQIALIRYDCTMSDKDWASIAEDEFSWVTTRYEDLENKASQSIQYFASHAYARRGYLAYQRNDAGSAISFMQQAIALASPASKADYTSILGDIYAAIGEKDKAIEAYQQAIAIAIGNADAASAEKYRQKLESVSGP